MPTPAPSACLKTSTVRTSILDPLGNFNSLLECFFLCCTSIFFTTLLQEIIHDLHSAEFFSIVSNENSFLGSYVQFSSYLIWEVLGLYPDMLFPLLLLKIVLIVFFFYFVFEVQVEACPIVCLFCLRPPIS